MAMGWWTNEMGLDTILQNLRSNVKNLLRTKPCILKSLTTELRNRDSMTAAHERYLHTIDTVANSFFYKPHLDCGKSRVTWITVFLKQTADAE